MIWYTKAEGGRNSQPTQQQHCNEITTTCSIISRSRLLSDNNPTTSTQLAYPATTRPLDNSTSLLQTPSRSQKHPPGRIWSVDFVQQLDAAVTCHAQLILGVHQDEAVGGRGLLPIGKKFLDNGLGTLPLLSASRRHVTS